MLALYNFFSDLISPPFINTEPEPDIEPEPEPDIELEPEPDPGPKPDVFVLGMVLYKIRILRKNLRMGKLAKMI